MGWGEWWVGEFGIGSWECGVGLAVRGPSVAVREPWFPAFAGMTGGWRSVELGIGLAARGPSVAVRGDVVSGFRRNDGGWGGGMEVGVAVGDGGTWFPAFAGMTGGGVEGWRLGWLLAMGDVVSGFRRNGRGGGVGGWRLGWLLAMGGVVSGFRRNDGGWGGGMEVGVAVGEGGTWFPAFAGMTGGGVEGWRLGWLLAMGGRGFRLSPE